MAQPIRWDNVNGAGLSEAGRPLEAAQRSFLGAFDTVGNVLQQRQQLEDQNWQNTRTNNTNAFLDAVAKYRSPEELRAAQAQGGALDQLRSGFGNQVDANAIRGAADAQVAKLQQQAQQEVAYNHMMTDERVAPLADKFKQASLNGDKVGMAAAQAEYEKLGGRDLAGLVSYADTRQQQMVQRGRDTQTFDNQLRAATDLHNTSVKSLAVADANIAQSNASVRASDSQVKYNQFNMDRTTKLDDAAIAAGRAEATKKALKDAGNIYADGVYNGSQSGDLMQTMVKNKIGDNDEDRSNIIKYLNQIQKDGIKITSPDGKQSITVHDLPLSAVEAAVNSASDSWWRVGWNTGAAKDMKANLTEILRTQYQDGNGQLRNKAVDDLAAFNQAIANARQNAPGIMPNRTPRPKQ